MMALVTVALAVSGCAVGNKHVLNEMQADFAASGEEDIALAVHDQRPDILSGNKEEHWAGSQRGGWGNPFDVDTASGQPLAADLSQVISRALHDQGFDVETLSVSARQSRDQVLQAMALGDAGRQVLLTMHQLKSDTYNNATLHYELLLEVFDAGGELLASTNSQGARKVGGSFWNAPEAAKQAVPPAIAELLEELFNQPRIIAALES